jgi:hypothetical protein
VNDSVQLTPWYDVISQAVSRRLPTAAALVRFYVGPCGICFRQRVSESGFLRLLIFPLPIFIPPTARYSLSILSSTLCGPDPDSVFK